MKMDAGAEQVAEKRLFCAFRFLSEGFALALGSRGTALTKSSPGYAQACGSEVLLFCKHFYGTSEAVPFRKIVRKQSFSARS